MRCDRCKAIVSDHDSHICQNINEAISNPREMCDRANMVIDRAISQGLITFMTPTARGRRHERDQALTDRTVDHHVRAVAHFAGITDSFVYVLADVTVVIADDRFAPVTSHRRPSLTNGSSRSRGWLAVHSFPEWHGRAALFRAMQRDRSPIRDPIYTRSFTACWSNARNAATTAAVHCASGLH